MIASRRALFTWLVCVGAAAACNQPEAPRGPVARAELGVFFGGQVQERKEIPFTLDRTKQTQGFRLTFHEALRAPVAVRWEIDRPAPRGRGRAVELGDAQARVGMRVFDQELMMKPGDPPGAWSVRVFVGDEVVVERRVEIYDPRTRRRDPVLSKRARP
jgi:hypothetical protein